MHACNDAFCACSQCCSSVSARSIAALCTLAVMHAYSSTALCMLAAMLLCARLQLPLKTTAANRRHGAGQKCFLLGDRKAKRQLSAAGRARVHPAAPGAPGEGRGEGLQGARRGTGWAVQRKGKAACLALACSQSLPALGFVFFLTREDFAVET